MLVFLCVSINNVTTQSIGNVVLAVLCDCKDMFADVWLSYYFINVDFFFFVHSCFSHFSEVILQENLVWKV